MEITYIVPIAAILALIFAYYKTSVVMKADAGDEGMQEIASQIQEGAMAFLAREYRVLGIFVLVVIFF